MTQLSYCAILETVKFERFFYTTNNKEDTARLNGTKATLLPNEAKDETYWVELDDLLDGYEEQSDDEFVSEMCGILHSQLEKQHFADVDAGLYDGATSDNPKPLDYYDHRELCDPDDFDDSRETQDEEFFELAERYGHL